MAAATARRRTSRACRAREFVATIAATLDEIQDGLLARARAFRDASTRAASTRSDEFYAFFTDAGRAEGEPTPIHGGFALTPLRATSRSRRKIKDDLA